MKEMLKENSLAMILLSQTNKLSEKSVEE